RAWGGGLSRFLLLRRFGDHDAALLADPRRLAREAPQEVQLGAPHPTLAEHLDFRDRRRVQRENPLHADAGGNLANGEGRVDPPAAAGGSTRPDRKSTRLNSRHVATSYAVFCLNKKKLDT